MTTETIAHVRPVTCSNPDHPNGCPFGQRLVDCAEGEARWWLATIVSGGLCLFSRKYDTRVDAESALLERLAQGIAA